MPPPFFEKIMKKITIILILLFAFVLAFKPVSIYAWDDCIFGKVNDEYPGDCARYIDTDNDDICDHSQPAPEDRDSFKTTNQENSEKENNVPVKRTKDYYLKQITLVLLIGYGVTFLLTKLGKISTFIHRKIWNVFLTLSFLITAILGIILILRLSYGLMPNPPFDMLFWHVETAIIFTIISIFHITWHFPYYKRLFK